MQLPESLQPWRQWLEWFAPELVPTLGALLGCISPLLGPFRGAQQGGVPEPDGLGDLRRRGSYERLLSSEWLLVDEFADEFLRRASSGEHLFLAPELRARQASRMIVVLFDAGPLQLGGARLVHLALMILLARRAAEHGAQFRWGVLQQEPELFEFHSSLQLRGLLDARTYRVVTEAHWQRWQATLAECPEAASECWLVGQRLPSVKGPTGQGIRVLQIQRGLFGDALELQAQPADAAPMVLPLPDKEAAQRLLKGQFVNEVPVDAHMTTAARISLTSSPLIGSAATHVAVRLLDEPGLLVFSIPRPGQKKSAKFKRQLWPRESTPLAMVLQNRQAGAVLSADEQLRFWQLPHIGTATRPPQEELLAPVDTATLLPAIYLRTSSHGRLFMLTSDRTLAYWMNTSGERLSATAPGRTYYQDRDVLSMARINDEVLVYANRGAGRLFVRHATLNATRYDSYSLGDGSEATQVLFSSLRFWRRRFGSCAVQYGHGPGESWTLFNHESHPQPLSRLVLAPGCKAIGLLHEMEGEQLALVVLGIDRRRVLLVKSGQTQEIFTATTKILQVSFCPDSTVLVLITEASELVVYVVSERQVRLQVQCNRKEQVDE
ncbi:MULTISPECIES: hypothetical protein [unclassified Pseudomonas]|uniref:hypothetical protein n=1 Tax=unclassified Pseudomonas TaxID=196821 RepID=UPI00128BE21E|nr:MULTISPECIES: hypothetical protein [unclassified Pseudomonas]MPQ70410.1 hypothetical protein [Pseudomonas sp. MWU12-2323]